MRNRHLRNKLFATMLFATAAILTMGFSRPAMAQSDCRAAITRFHAIVDSDARSGNLNRSVYLRMQPDLQRVGAECQAGHDAQSLRDLRGVKARYGYH